LTAAQKARVDALAAKQDALLKDYNSALKTTGASSHSLAELRIAIEAKIHTLKEQQQELIKKSTHSLVSIKHMHLSIKALKEDQDKDAARYGSLDK
jgi:seryl-tRNA synthetase